MFASLFWRYTFELMDRDFDLNQFLSKHDRKLIFFDLSWERTVPNSDHPLHFIISNSLLLLIQLAVIGKALRIVLFGADGGCGKNVNEWYYRQEDSGHRGSATGEFIVAPQENLIYDTDRYFNLIFPIAIRNIYKTYNLAPIDTLNCSENRAFTPPSPRYHMMMLSTILLEVRNSKKKWICVFQKYLSLLYMQILENL